MAQAAEQAFFYPTLYPAHAQKESRALCRVAPHDLGLILNPREGASRGGEAKCANRQNNDVVDLFLTESGFSGVANRGVRGALETGANREGKFDQSARAFIKWARLMTSFPKMGESAPDVRIKTFELRDRLWKLLSHAHAPFSRIRFRPSLAGEASRFTNPSKTNAKLFVLVGFDHRAR
jgi:hypothetical protein